MGFVAIKCHLGSDWFAHASAILVRIIWNALAAPNNPKALQDQSCSHIAVGGLFRGADAAFRPHLSIAVDVGPVLHFSELSFGDLADHICFHLHAVVVVWGDQVLLEDATCCFGGLYDDGSCRDFRSTVCVRDSIRSWMMGEFTYEGNAFVL